MPHQYFRHMPTNSPLRAVRMYFNLMASCFEAEFSNHMVKYFSFPIQQGRFR